MQQFDAVSVEASWSSAAPPQRGRRIERPELPRYQEIAPGPPALARWYEGGALALRFGRGLNFVSCPHSVITFNNSRFHIGSSFHVVSEIGGFHVPVAHESDVCMAGNVDRSSSRARTRASGSSYRQPKLHD